MILVKKLKEKELDETRTMLGEALDELEELDEKNKRRRKSA